MNCSDVFYFDDLNLMLIINITSLDVSIYKLYVNRM